MAPTSFDYKKATQAINYLASCTKSHQINIMRVLKLIWAADRYHIRKYGRTVLGDKYIAMQFGPVASKVKDLMERTVALQQNEAEYRDQFIKKVNKYTIESANKVDLDVFSDSDIEALKFAIKEFGRIEKYNLSNFTHEYPEWKKYEQLLESGKSQWEIINQNDFFKNPTNIKKDPFKIDEENLNISKEIFRENVALYNFL